MEIKVVKQPHQGGHLPRFGYDGLFKRTPAPPPFWSMNSTPARSKACLTTSNVERRGSFTPASSCRTVTIPTPA